MTITDIIDILERVKVPDKNDTSAEYSDGFDKGYNRACNFAQELLTNYLKEHKEAE